LLDPTPSRITLAARLLNNSLFAALETPTLLRLSTDGDLQIIDSGSQLLLDRESIGISVTEGRDSPSASDIVNRAGLTGKNADTEAVIDGPAEVLVLPAALVRKEIERSPALAQALLQQLGGDDVAA
jgi:CRP-like cAMP-binding protein